MPDPKRWLTFADKKSLITISVDEIRFISARRKKNGSAVVTIGTDRGEDFTLELVNTPDIATVAKYISRSGFPTGNALPE